MELSFPKLKVVAVALNVPELVKKAPAPERLMVADLHVTVAPLAFCSELLSFPKLIVPDVTLILPELVTVEGVPVKLKLPLPVTLIVPVLVILAVELIVQPLQLSVPALVTFPLPLLRLTVPVKVTVAPEFITNSESKLNVTAPAIFAVPVPLKEIPTATAVGCAILMPPVRVSVGALPVKLIVMPETPKLVDSSSAMVTLPL
jgi:hypothetical protein